MLRNWLIALALVAGFIVPLLVTQELGYWRSDDWVSHLVWDEAQTGPGEPHAPAPADGRLVAAQMAGGLAVATALLAAVMAWRTR